MYAWEVPHELVRKETPGSEFCCSVSRTCVRIAADIKSRRRPYQVTHGMGWDESAVENNGPAAILLLDIGVKGLISYTNTALARQRRASTRALMSVRGKLRGSTEFAGCDVVRGKVKQQQYIVHGQADRQTAGGCGVNQVRWAEEDAVSQARSLQGELGAGGSRTIGRDGPRR